MYLIFLFPVPSCYIPKSETHQQNGNGRHDQLQGNGAAMYEDHKGVSGRKIPLHQTPAPEGKDYLPQFHRQMTKKETDPGDSKKSHWQIQFQFPVRIIENHGSQHQQHDGCQPLYLHHCGIISRFPEYTGGSPPENPDQYNKNTVSSVFVKPCLHKLTIKPHQKISLKANAKHLHQKAEQIIHRKLPPYADNAYRPSQNPNISPSTYRWSHLYTIV